jgi:flavin reductase (DIM6/NTAB) family NADH-FMN oxidoreductase RutF
MPVSIVGALVKGKPNFLTVAWITIVSHEPQRIAIVLNRNHYTTPGITEMKTFSISIPSEEMIEITDYCCLVSGRKTNKSELFQVFYGELETAPMIQECPLNVECQLEKTIEIGSTDMFIGKIHGIYTEEKYMKEGTLDLQKVRPLILSGSNAQYLNIGKNIGSAWSIGKNMINTPSMKSA